MAIQPAYIQRRAKPDKLSFEALLQEGIALSQALSGHIWSDYNTHDPGVTLLEQLCFVLSDIAYRADHAVPDYLLGDQVHFDLSQHALYPAEQIFDAHPASNWQLAAHIKTQIPAVDSVHIVPAVHAGVSSTLLDIYVCFDALYLADQQQQQQEQLLDKIRQVYARCRNLNENLNQVLLKQTTVLQVAGSIHIDSAYNASEILANVYFAIAEKISRLQESSEQESHEQYPRNLVITTNDLFSVVGAVDDVVAIRELTLIDENGLAMQQLQIDPARHSVSLHLPQSEQQIAINVIAASKTLALQYGRFITQFFQLSSVYKRTKKSSLQGSQYQQTVATPIDRNLGSFTSITQHFPSNYQLQTGQVSPHANAQQRAQNLQAKAYIGMFDQLLYGYTLQLENIRRWFAPLHYAQPVGSNVDSSTFDISKMRATSKALNEHMACDLDKIRVDDFAEQLNQLDQQHDVFFHTANKVLDYLLALYGEKMTQNNLSMFSQAEDQAELLAQQVSNKLRMLKYIKAVTRNRIKACNLYSDAKDAEDISGLALKLSLLLGFTHFSQRALHRLGPEQNGLHMIEHALLGQHITAEQSENLNLHHSFFNHQITLIFPSWTRLSSLPEFQKLVAETVMINTPAHLYANVLFVSKAHMRQLDKLLLQWWAGFKQPSAKQGEVALDLLEILSRLINAPAEQVHELA